MAIVELTLPFDEHLIPQRQELGIRDPALINRSIFSGVVQTANDPFGRWMTTLNYNNIETELQHERAAFFDQLGGRSKRLRMGNIERPRPAGTLGGTVILTNVLNQFDEEMDITATNGMTIKRGDMLGVAGMLFRATADAVVSGGTATVAIAPRVRATVSGGTAVVWDYPTAQFILSDDAVLIPFEPRVSPGFAVSFEETW